MSETIETPGQINSEKQVEVGPVEPIEVTSPRKSTLAVDRVTAGRGSYRTGRRNLDLERLRLAATETKQESPENTETESKPIEIKRDKDNLKTIRYFDTKPLSGISAADPNLPIVPIQQITIEGVGGILTEDTDAFRGAVARIPAHEDEVPSGEDKVKKMYTNSVTRGSTSWGDIVIGGTHFSAVVGKGDGSHKAFAETGSCYSREDIRFKHTRATDRGYASGIMTKSEAYKDAQSSLARHRAGVRTRIPVAGYALEQVAVDGVNYTSEHFVDEFADGNKEEAPYVLEMAIRSPFRFNEAMDIFNDASRDGNFSGIDELMSRTINQAEKDDHDKYRQLGEKWRLKIGTRGVYTPEEAYAFLEDFGKLYTDVLGEGLGKIHRGGEIHGNLHASNSTFMAEIVDNVTSRQVRDDESERKAEMIHELNNFYKEQIASLAFTLESFRQKLLPKNQANITYDVLADVLRNSYNEHNPGLVGLEESISNAWRRITIGDNY